MTDFAGVQGARRKEKRLSRGEPPIVRAALARNYFCSLASTPKAELGSGEFAGTGQGGSGVAFFPGLSMGLPQY